MYHTSPKETVLVLSREIKRPNCIVLENYILPLKLCSSHINFAPLHLSVGPPSVTPSHVWSTCKLGLLSEGRWVHSPTRSSKNLKNFDSLLFERPLLSERRYFSVKLYDVSTTVFPPNLLSETMPKYAVKVVSSCDCLHFPTCYVRSLVYVHLNLPDDCRLKRTVSKHKVCNSIVSGSISKVPMWS